MLPLLLLPCVPAIVACSTADVRADSGAQITPAVVARTGPPPLLLRPLSKNDAEALNRRIPFSLEPQVPAAPFAAGKDEVARARALDCLTSAIYYEAASETENGQRAVAQVILNRVRHPAFPASVCGVVHQGSTLRTGCQFSFTCDGSLQRVPSSKEWDRANAVAAAALAGAVYAPVGLATHYHADYVVPYWAPSLAKTFQVGAHIFYRWPGAWGRTPSFTQRYAGNESDPAALRNIALLSHRIWPAADLPDKPRLALTIDPEVELGGVLHLLASEPAAEAGPFERSVRAYFEAEAASPAVAMLTSAAPVAEQAVASAAALPASPDAKPAASVPVVVAAAAVPPSLKPLDKDLVRKSKLAAFLRSKRPLYKVAADRVVRLAEEAAVDWETYSGTAVPGHKAVLSLARGAGSSLCPAPALRSSIGPVVDWPADARDFGPADAFFASGLAQASLLPPPSLTRGKAKALRAVTDPVAEQLVAAVFARVAALSRGEDVGNAVLRTEVAKGHTLVPMLAQRLRFYEQHRDQYATLNAFLPTLTAGVAPLSPPSNIVAEATDRASCGPAAGAAS